MGQRFINPMGSIDDRWHKYLKRPVPVWLNPNTAYLCLCVCVCVVHGCVYFPPIRHRWVWEEPSAVPRGRVCKHGGQLPVRLPRWTRDRPGRLGLSRWVTSERFLSEPFFFGWCMCTSGVFPERWKGEKQRWCCHRADSLNDKWALDPPPPPHPTAVCGLTEALWVFELALCTCGIHSILFNRWADMDTGPVSVSECMLRWKKPIR